MVSNKGTAEEQLLKLIEGGAASVPPAAVVRGPHGWFRWLGRSARSRPVGRDRDPWLQRLQLAGHVLWVGMMVLAGLLIADHVWLRGNHHARSSSETPSTAAVAKATKPEDYMKPMSVYIRSATEQNPFTGAAGPEPVVPLAPVVAKGPQLKSLTEGLTVVGIDRSDTPRVIIEDTVKHRTYFVRVGEEVGGATVARITSSGVVLSYEGEELELPY